MLGLLACKGKHDDFVDVSRGWSFVSVPLRVDCKDGVIGVGAGVMVTCS